MNPSGVFDTARKLAPLVTWFGSPVLRSPCSEIPPSEITSSETQMLVNRLIDTLQAVRSATGIGRGLSAPQVGETKRIFVIFYEEEYHVFINPSVISFASDYSWYPEMCLSGFPLAAKVKRPTSVKIKYYDDTGNLTQLSSNGILARIIQHEMDHLDGILFIDRADLATVEIVTDLEKFSQESKFVFDNANWQ